MRNFLLFLCLVLAGSDALAQTETANYRSAAEKFERYYNRGSYDSIFALFSAEMKTALPLQQTNAFFTQQQTSAGKILKREFVNYQSTAAIYKTTFERALFALLISVDDKGSINGLYLKPYPQKTTPASTKRNTTPLVLPFKDAWTVVWGGDTEAQNYHVVNKTQQNAFDIVITNETHKRYKTDGKTNEDYYAFGKELTAPCDGEIVAAADGIKDNQPGVMNKTDIFGNYIILKATANEYLVFAHFRQHSIKVKKGQQVKQGQLLGLCGNSGHSSEPHLHLHMQDTADPFTATGVKSYFKTLLVNGQIKNDYSPVQGDIIQNNR